MHTVGRINSVPEVHFNLAKNFESAKESVKNKLLGIFKMVEDKFNVSFNLKIEESSFGFVINDEYTYEFVMYNSDDTCDFKLIGPQNLKFNVNDFLFKFDNSSESTFSFLLTGSFDLFSLMYISSSKSLTLSLSTLKSTKLNFNKNLDLIELELKTMNLVNKEKQSTIIKKDKNMVMTIEDEAILFSLMFQNKEYVEELFPEFVHHGAYDFSGQEFKERLDIWQMLKI